jgi:hypothetical protein
MFHLMLALLNLAAKEFHSSLSEIYANFCMTLLDISMGW